jgi:hypothetical protein
MSLGDLRGSLGTLEDEPDPDAEACELEQYRHQPSTGCL